MQIVFRTDASLNIGTGHVIRCLTLAEQLRNNGAEIHFICRTHDGHLCTLIEQRGFKVFRLPVTASEAIAGKGQSHTHWLGTSWQKDAQETSEIISSLCEKPTWLVIDHYALDHQWQRKQRALVDRILVIDDLADRAHDCDLLLDQNLLDNFQQRYAGLVPDSCSVLLGPQYALLQPIYDELHDRIPFREGPVKRVLVFFGGADVENITGMTLKALIDLKKKDIVVDVVLGHSCPHKQLIYQVAQNRKNINVHSSLPSLAPLIAHADLAIGGCGTATWERLCLGLPSLVITLADNQKQIADILHRLKLIHLVGHIDKVKIEFLQQILEKFVLQNVEQGWSERCQITVDGKGTPRVAASILTNSQTMLQARRAKVSDEAQLLEWTNDPETRRNGFSVATVTPEEHHQWFITRLRDIEGCFIFIVENLDGVPVGQVRFQRDEEDIYEIHYSLAKCFRGRKIGKHMLETTLNHFG